MVTRVISTIVALPLLFFFVLMGGLYLEVAAALVTLIGLHELFKSFKKNLYKPFENITYILVLFTYIVLHYNNYSLLLFGLAFYIGFVLLQYLFDKDRKFSDVGLTLTGVFYILFFVYHVILLSKVEPSFFIWYIFIVSWGADTGAFFAGRAFGKKKLFERVSPKKTVEGAIGGIVSAVLFAGIFTLYFDKTLVIYSMIIGAFGSSISILGDLIASRIKREMDVKDFGAIMPGHGGVLDRFDSLLFVTPFVYYFIIFFIN